MPSKRPDRGLDFSQNAFRIVQEATGQAPKSEAPAKASSATHAARGSVGGKKGGTARAKSLSSKKRSQIARKAARARWKRS